ncbi:2-oxoacid ferredoxin oxidoreductase [Candidatus Heimdallarchaeota archaeon B3_Heim]|nr:MAG: 2-oxoacid ferredoxin oxidoreductase [Candidatus Heimdallarchaeota archaeon B3_Heim]
MMVNSSDFDREVEVHWCPGCGNYPALKILKETLTDLNITPNNAVIVTGIGQAGKFSHFIEGNMINGLHGRYLSNALAIKASNPELSVFAISGDGCTYSEGGNHFLHTMRYNPSIVNIVHDNAVYGLTKGQASPTSEIGVKTGVQTLGVYNTPFNPIAVAIAQNASFVARAFVGHAEQTKEILKKAIAHKGYAFIDLFSPCVSFNRINTYQWYRENTYYLEDSYTPFDQKEAIGRALERSKLPLGVFYINERPTYEDNIQIYKNDSRPLWERDLSKEKLKTLINSFR